MAEWKEITDLSEWQQALDNSGDKPFVILKHSTQCPVSFNALKEYESYLSSNPNPDYNYLLVKVIESRPVSNQIAADIKVTHASPQIILVKNKEQGWNTSHWSVTNEHITAVLD